MLFLTEHRKAILEDLVYHADFDVANAGKLPTLLDDVVVAAVVVEKFVAVVILEATGATADNATDTHAPKEDESWIDSLGVGERLLVVEPVKKLVGQLLLAALRDDGIAIMAPEKGTVHANRPGKRGDEPVITEGLPEIGFATAPNQVERGPIQHAFLKLADGVDVRALDDLKDVRVQLEILDGVSTKDDCAVHKYTCLSV